MLVTVPMKFLHFSLAWIPPRPGKLPVSSCRNCLALRSWKKRLIIFMLNVEVPCLASWMTLSSTFAPQKGSLQSVLLHGWDIQTLASIDAVSKRFKLRSSTGCKTANLRSYSTERVLMFAELKRRTITTELYLSPKRHKQSNPQHQPVDHEWQHADAVEQLQEIVDTRVGTDR